MEANMNTPITMLTVGQFVHVLRETPEARDLLKEIVMSVLKDEDIEKIIEEEKNDKPFTVPGIWAKPVEHTRCADQRRLPPLRRHAWRQRRLYQGLPRQRQRDRLRHTARSLGLDKLGLHKKRVQNCCFS